jgi:pyrroline-5-carboxylate reductase
MPNTPAMVGEAMSAICANEKVSDEQLTEAKALFESFGQVEVVSENLMDVVTGVSGSSPAFIYMVIEAMADAAVLEGMQRPAAYKFASQAVLGAAKMVLSTGQHPGALKDAVTSPGGTTIAGIAALEEHGLRSTMIEGVRAAVEKSRDMTK